MKKIIQKFGMEVLSKDEMRNITGGNPPNINVTCDVCDGNNCEGSTTGFCPEATAEACNGRDAGSGYTYRNCVEA